MGLVIPFPSTASAGRRGAAVRGAPQRLASMMAATERLLDWSAVVAGACLAFVFHSVRGGYQQRAVPQLAVAEVAAFFGVMVVLLLERHGEYRPYLSLLAVRETERLLRLGAECCLLVLSSVWLAAPLIPRTLALSCLVTVPVALIAEKTAWHMLLRWSPIAGRGRQRAVVFGAGLQAKNIYSILLRSPKLGLDPVAIVDEEAAVSGIQIRANSYWQKKPALVLAGPLSAALFRNMDASTLIIADPSLNNAEVADIAASAASVGVTTYLVSRDYLGPDTSLDYSELDGVMLACPAAEQPRMAHQLIKRSMDLALASFLLLLAALPWAVVVALIRLSSPGPALFRQVRVGHHGRLFYLYKFRSMFVDSPAYAFSPTNGLDSRITPIGRWLRRTCLDELPQLWNVLKGDMSLVGPRPEMPFIVERYNTFQRRRLAVKPGITGLWQLSGDRTRLIHENMEYDLYYIDDCVEGLLRLMASSYREPLNLGTDELISVDGLVDLVCEIAGKRLVIRHDLTKPQGVRGRNSDNSRLRQALGWEPSIRLRDGLKITYLWIEGQLRKARQLESVFAYAAD